MVENLPMPALMLMTLGGLMLVGYVVISFTNAYVSRMGSTKNDAALPPDLSGRLHRMEQTLDALAVEMERVSEAQRFTAKLLSDQVSRPSAIAPAREPESRTRR